jgi:hypothetical protein
LLFSKIFIPNVGVYVKIKHCNAELAYALELPKQHGEAQKELGLEKETSYIITAQ